MNSWDNVLYMCQSNGPFFFALIPCKNSICVIVTGKDSDVLQKNTIHLPNCNVPTVVLTWKLHHAVTLYIHTSLPQYIPFVTCVWFCFQLNEIFLLHLSGYCALEIWILIPFFTCWCECSMVYVNDWCNIVPWSVLILFKSSVNFMCLRWTGELSLSVLSCVWVDDVWLHDYVCLVLCFCCALCLPILIMYIKSIQ